MAVDDDGFTSIPSRGASHKKSSRENSQNRIRIGNLPVLLADDQEVKCILAARLDVATVCISVVEPLSPVPQHGNSHSSVVVVITGMSAEAALARLRGLHLMGQKVVVTRDQRNSSTYGKARYGTGATKSTGPSSAQSNPQQLNFGSWSKPKAAANSTRRQGSNEEDPLASDAFLVTSPDETAASGRNGNTSKEAGETTASMSDIDTPKVAPSLDFATLCRNPLSQLLEDYGEEDPDWMNLIPGSVEPKDSNVENDLLAARTTSNASVDADVPETINRLQRHGEAPIHVEFVSFGYRHGIPAEVRVNATGHSHRQPLVAFDARTCLEEVPHYLAWMDGLSGAVKNTMIRHRPNSIRTPRGNGGINSNCKAQRGATDQSPTQASDASTKTTDCLLNVRDYARDVIAAPVADALEEAMKEHGYVDPLQMSIYVGSELGRHRSVVAAEQAATALRKLLRENAHNRFSCAVSVGCRHRDIERKCSVSNNTGGHGRDRKPKNKDLDDE